MLVQRYVSTDLTHFVGAKLKAQRDQYRLLKRILKSGTLKASPGPVTAPQYLLVRKTHLPLSSNEACLGSVVCFCDIPLCDLPLHMSKYSSFGLAFTKDFLAEFGALPVIYVPVRGRPALLPYEDYGRKRVASQAVAFNEFWRLFQRIENAAPAFEKAKLPEAARDLRRMMRFLECNVVSNFKFFDHRLDDTEDEHYYMEREWRVGQNVTFALDDVTRIIIPEGHGGQFRRDFPNFDGEIVFSDWEH
jgi:Putative abortive phage resistance protein AbiGi, antitoxin